MSDTPEKPQPTINDLTMMMHTRPKADTMSQYKEKMLELIQLRFNLGSLGSPLEYLNRRFSLLSRQFGVPPRIVATELANEGHVTLVTHKKNVLCFPTVEFDEYLAMFGVSVEQRATDSVKLYDRSLTD